jgi:inosine-uridine nucleoside N-ribohydrolase
MPRERRSKYANDAKDTAGIASQVESLSSSLAQKAKQSDLDVANTNIAKKADKTYVDSVTQSIASGAPKGTYATLSALQTAFPTGTTGIYLVTADGKWYYWSGSAWTAGGIYQSTGIAPNSVTDDKIASGVDITKLKQVSVKTSGINLFDKEKAVLGFQNISTGAFIAGSSSWEGKYYYTYVSDFMPCSPSQTIIKSQREKGTEVTFWDENYQFVSGLNTWIRNFTVPADSRIKYMKTSVLVNSTDSEAYKFLVSIDDFMVVSGSTLPEKYVPFNVKSLTGKLNIETNLPRPVIFDTDWAYDTDDIVAARVLLWAERCGMIDIVSLAVSYNLAETVPSMDSFFTFEGRPGLNIGVERGTMIYGTWTTGTWHPNMSTHPRTYTSTESAESAVRMYRRALSTCKQPIDIIVTGLLTNIYNLMISPADDISPMTGMELIMRYVRKMWVMGGQYPSGSEANFINSWSIAGTSYVCANFPKPITFLGYEVGNTVKTGDTLATVSPKEYDPLTQALYETNRVNGGFSWDPMLTLLACYGDLNVAGYSSVKGFNTVNATTGANSFDPNFIDKHHEYVVKTKNDFWYKRQINSIIEKNAWSMRPLGAQQLPKP